MTNLFLNREICKQLKFSKCPNSSEDGRVRIFEENFEWVGREVGEVVDGKFFQRINQRNRLAGGFGGEGVGFIFVFP